MFCSDKGRIMHCYLTLECKDNRGLVRPQAFTQQSQTGEGDHKVWCNYNRGKLYDLVKQ